MQHSSMPSLVLAAGIICIEEHLVNTAIFPDENVMFLHNVEFDVFIQEPYFA